VIRDLPRDKGFSCSQNHPDLESRLTFQEKGVLERHMYPWHYLVCDAVQGGTLPASTGRFVTANAARVPAEPQILPDRVARLVELGRARRESADLPYLDYEYWLQVDESTTELAGIIAFRDER
jgi:hypothetical protein